MGPSIADRHEEFDRWVVLVSDYAGDLRKWLVCSCVVCSFDEYLMNWGDCRFRLRHIICGVLGYAGGMKHFRQLGVSC